MGRPSALSAQPLVQRQVSEHSPSQGQKSRRSGHSDILLSADMPVIEFASSGIWSCHQACARSCVQGSPSSTSPSIFQTSSAEQGRFLFHWRVIFAIQRSLLWSLLFPQFREVVHLHSLETLHKHRRSKPIEAESRGARPGKRI